MLAPWLQDAILVRDASGHFKHAATAGPAASVFSAPSATIDTVVRTAPHLSTLLLFHCRMVLPPLSFDTIRNVEQLAHFSPVGLVGIMSTVGEKVSVL